MTGQWPKIGAATTTDYLPVLKPLKVLKPMTSRSMGNLSASPEFNSFNTFNSTRAARSSTTPTAAEVVRRGHCTAGCLTAGSPPTGCRCPCGGTLHGHLAETPVDISGVAR